MRRSSVWATIGVLTLSVSFCISESDSEAGSVPVRGGRVVVLRHDRYNAGAGGGSVTWKAVDERLFLGFPIRRTTLVDYDDQPLKVEALNDSMVQITVSSSFGGGGIHRVFKVPPR